MFSLRRVLPVLGLLAICLATAGCGEPDEPLPFCNTGCVSGGVCQPGTEANACGRPGGVCVQCPPGQKCESGQCKTGCSGCLDESQSCQAGSSTSSCGSGGARCLACAQGASCLGGTCQQLCNAAMCPDGCCSTSGKCEAVVSAAACGRNGSPCTTCGATQECTQGECVDKVAGCTGCQGCCSSEQKCLGGDKVTACGKAGAACVACPANHSCVDGACKPNPTPCDAQTCANGCCQSGVCILFAQQTPQLCGKGGTTCSVCGSTATCVQGTCVEDQPCFSYCKIGCCTTEGQCLGFGDQDKTVCGNGGTPCTACGAGYNCLSGGCVGDPVWDLWVVSAVIAAKKPDGDVWDGWPKTGTSQLPDPYLGMCLGKSYTCWSPSQTPSIDNTLTPYWNKKLGSWKETELITQGLAISIVDDDNLSDTFNDKIGQCLVTITGSAMLQGGSYTIPTCGTGASSVKLNFVKQ